MDLARLGKRLAKTVFVLQLFSVTLLALGYWLVVDPSSAMAVGTGGAIGIATNAIFACYAFKHAAANNRWQMLNNLKKGSKIKLLITVLSFALLFQIPFYQNIEVIIGYCCAMLVQYPILILVSSARPHSPLINSFLKLTN